MAKHWIFTDNNPLQSYDADDYFGNEPIVYSVIGEEVGEKCGTLHNQGYVCFVSKKHLSGVKKVLPRAHWEQKRGTNKEASDYCKKDGKWHEIGECPPEQHERGSAKAKIDWDLQKKLAIEGKLEEIDAGTYIRNYNTLKRIASDHQPKKGNLEFLCNEWHFGDTGVGKSRPLREKYPNAFIKDANIWWDGYQGEEVVIIEDVDIYDLKLGRHFKLWGDYYPFPANMKHCGKLDIRPKRIFVTSNYSPREIWSDPKTYEPIERRYKVKQITKKIKTEDAPLVPIEVIDLCDSSDSHEWTDTGSDLD